MPPVKSNLNPKRKVLSLLDKINILDRLQKGEKVASVAKSLSLNESTVRTIQKNDKKIRTSVCAGAFDTAKRTSYTRDASIEKMEKLLIIWIEHAIDKHIPLSTNVITQKALKIYDCLEQPDDTTCKSKFVASHGWFEKFKMRAGLRSLLIQGESSSGDKNAAQEFPIKFLQLIKDGGYHPHQVFNADETGLVWKSIPKRSFVLDKNSTAAGHKQSKERVTLLMCSNASGDFVMKPLFLNKFLNPRCMKHVNKSKLPVYWRANKKAWVTSKMFEDWFQNIFAKETETYMKIKNLDFKIMLVIDNAPCHPKNLKHPNIEVVFLPPNTTSLLQPLDQGIIATFKSYYIKISLQFILDLMEKMPNLDLSDLWKEFSILTCVNVTSQSIKNLKSSTLNGCWKKLWAEVVPNDNVATPVTAEVSQILQVIGTSELFENIVEEDILEMINDVPELTEHDLIELATESNESTEDDSSDSDDNPDFDSSKLKTLIQMAEDLIKFSTDNDPRRNRSDLFQCSIQKSLASYKELLQQQEKQKKQKRITEFFKVDEDDYYDENSEDVNYD